MSDRHGESHRTATPSEEKARCNKAFCRLITNRQKYLRYHAGGVRGKAQGADCRNEERDCGNQGKRKKRGLTEVSP